MIKAINGNEGALIDYQGYNASEGWNSYIPIMFSFVIMEK
jgi:hypothetical protein